MTKLCRICKFEKKLDEFGLNKKNHDGRESRCKNCRKTIYLSNNETILIKAKEKYDQNPKLFRERRSESYRRCKIEVCVKKRARRAADRSIKDSEKGRRHRIKNNCFNLLGGKCVLCGICDNDVLCVDHILDDGKMERDSGTAVVTIWRKIIRGEELFRYQLLCFNCNFKKFITKYKLKPLIGINKPCSFCKRTLDVSNFKRSKKCKDGRHYACGECIRDINANMKNIAMAALGSSICAVCRSNDECSLTVDHINNDGHLSRKTDGLGMKIYKHIIDGDMDISKFQVLCLNCNIKKYLCFIRSASNVE